ncbi:unnamed protein product [Musa textilis]
MSLLTYSIFQSLPPSFCGPSFLLPLNPIHLFHATTQVRYGSRS